MSVLRSPGMLLHRRDPSFVAANRAGRAFVAIPFAATATPGRPQSWWQALDRVRPEALAFGFLVGLWPWILLFGREPWKADEAYSFGLVYSMLEGKGLLIPLLGGQRFIEKPPLFYWVASAFARALGDFLPPHEAARIALGVFGAATLGLVAATARALGGNGRGWLAVVLLIGSIGYFEKAHLLVTDVGLLAGLCTGLYGFAIARTRPIAGGVALGIGAALAFMCKGLIGPGVLALTAMGLLAFRNWRTPGFLRCIRIALAVALPLVAVWPALVYSFEPALFRVWLWDNQFGRFLDFARLGEHHGPLFYPLLLSWTALPSWPLIAVGLPLMLAQTLESNGPDTRLPPRAALVWEGARPGDGKERLRLYQIARAPRGAAE